MDKKNIPKVQYALFCKDIIETDTELTFKHVSHELFVPNPGDISIHLVLRLLNVYKGHHNISIQCILPSLEPSLELLTLDIPLDVDKYGNCLWSEKLTIPTKASGDYVFTILFNNTQITRLTLPIHILYTQ